MNEFDLISKYFSPLAKAVRGAEGLTDDACFLKIKNTGTMVVTTDTIIEDVHYISDTPAELIARKLLRVNISDLAAKSAIPAYYTLNITMNEKVDEAWLDSFTRGLKADQRKYGIMLAGGDTTRSTGRMSFSVTAIGESIKPVKRATAKQGDIIYVTGSIGDSFLGLQLRQSKLERTAITRADYFINRYNLPEPKLDFGVLLGGFASAACDISDGLVADLGHICQASDAAAMIRSSAIPLSTQALSLIKRGSYKLEQFITHGDDYEICFTVPPHKQAIAEEAARKTETRISAIGEVIKGKGVLVINDKGRPVIVNHGGYSHF